jgi:hypothetical protein
MLIVTAMALCPSGSVMVLPSTSLDLATRAALKIIEDERLIGVLHGMGCKP